MKEINKTPSNSSNNYNKDTKNQEQLSIGFDKVKDIRENKKPDSYVEAMRLHKAGFKVIPIKDPSKPDGKKPLCKWKKYQEKQTEEDVRTLFSISGIGGIALLTTDGIEVIDIDLKYVIEDKNEEYDFFTRLSDAVIDNIGLETFQKLILSKTVNNGYHLFYRTNIAEGNHNLAKRYTEEDEKKSEKDNIRVLIETRGIGGYIIIPPTKGYEYDRKYRTILDIPLITDEERNGIINACRLFNETKEIYKQKAETPKEVIKDRKTTIHAFNESHTPKELIESAGWQLKFENKDNLFYVRPGKTLTQGHGASYCQKKKMFYVFTTSTEFEPNRAYNAFQVYSILNHAGDQKATAKELYGQGYGDRMNKEKTIKEISVVYKSNTSFDIGIFNIKTPNQCLYDASTKPIPMMLFDSFWFQGEICILFADTNLGKSVLAVQIGDSISRGESILGLKQELEKTNVLYLDFELSDKQFEKRCSDEYKNHYSFSDNFYRAEINPDSISDEIPFEEYLNSSLITTIEKQNIKVIIIDNLTWLSNETEKAKNALPLMKDLQKIKTKYNLSLLLIAHTPKRDLTKPISQNDLQGSKMLINFCDSCFAIGQSTKDPNLRYIKQIKVRNTDKTYNSENVLVCQILKDINFVKFEFIEFGSEKEHLKTISNSDKEKMEMEIVEMKKNNPHYSYREIGRNFGINHNTVKRIIDRDERSGT
jgi:hypothetical protein